MPEPSKSGQYRPPFEIINRALYEPDWLFASALALLGGRAHLGRWPSLQISSGWRLNPRRPPAAKEILAQFTSRQNVERWLPSLAPRAPGHPHSPGGAFLNAPVNCMDHLRQAKRLRDLAQECREPADVAKGKQARSACLILAASYDVLAVREEVDYTCSKLASNAFSSQPGKGHVMSKRENDARQRVPFIGQPVNRT